MITAWEAICPTKKISSESACALGGDFSFARFNLNVIAAVWLSNLFAGPKEAYKCALALNINFHLHSLH